MRHARTTTPAGLAISMLLVGAGCTPPPSPAPAPTPTPSPSPMLQTNAFTDPESGSTLAVEVGKPFTLELQANATTGYSWSADVDDTMLAVNGNDYVSDGGAGAMAGTGGHTTFTFTLLKPGSTKLKMVYARPWEKDPSLAAKVIELTISGQ